MELPFKLYKYHKNITLRSWTRQGLIHDDKDSLYHEYIYATNCDLCGIEFKSSNDRHMDHKHLNGKYGPFRNFVCTSCNQRKSDKKMKSNNTSGYPGICKDKSKTCKQGFVWKFQVYIDGKRKKIKTSTDFDKLVKFAEKWKKVNHYHT